jgi:hypothetical protein
MWRMANGPSNSKVKNHIKPVLCVLLEWYIAAELQHKSRKQIKLNEAVGTNHGVEGVSLAIESRLRVGRTEDLCFDSRHREEVTGKGLLLCRLQIGSVAHPASSSLGTGFVPGGREVWTYIWLLLKFTASGSVPSFPLYLSGLYRENLSLFCFMYNGTGLV